MSHNCQFRGYDYYGKSAWLQIVNDPETDEADFNEVESATDELAEMLVLDRNRLLNEVEQYFHNSIKT